MDHLIQNPFCLILSLAEAIFERERKKMMKQHSQSEIYWHTKYNSNVSMHKSFLIPRYCLLRTGWVLTLPLSLRIEFTLALLDRFGIEIDSSVTGIKPSLKMGRLPFQFSFNIVDSKKVDD